METLGTGISTLIYNFIFNIIGFEVKSMIGVFLPTVLLYSINTNW